MKNSLLLPHRFKVIGFIMLPLAVAFLTYIYIGDHNNLSFFQTSIISHEFLGDEKINLSGTVAIIWTVICLFMVAFSREKYEDEYVMAVRLKALQISVYVNYGILGLATMFLYGFNFLFVMQLNLFTILVLFIVVYYFQLYIKPRFSKSNPA